MEPWGHERHRWANRRLIWAGAHESTRAASEFQYPASGAVSLATGQIRQGETIGARLPAETDFEFAFNFARIISRL